MVKSNYMTWFCHCMTKTYHPTTTSLLDFSQLPFVEPSPVSLQYRNYPTITNSVLLLSHFTHPYSQKHPSIPVLWAHTLCFDVSIRVARTFVAWAKHWWQHQPIPLSQLIKLPTILLQFYTLCSSIVHTVRLKQKKGWSATRKFIENAIWLSQDRN